MNKTDECPCCGFETKLAKRSFSAQATAALVVWGEMNPDQIGKPICDDCYTELRESLIDRSDELVNIDPNQAADIKAG